MAGLFERKSEKSQIINFCVYCGEPPIFADSSPPSMYILMSDYLYSMNPICNANCVRKYTSVYLLLSTNLFAFVFRELLYWRPE